MKFFPHVLAPLLAIAVVHTELVSSQSSGGGLLRGIGTKCSNALQSLLTNADLDECLQLDKAISAFSALPARTSVIPALDDYVIHDLCPAVACSPAALQSANTTISQSCAAELNGPHSFLPGMALIVLTEFVSMKQAFCLQDPKNNNQSCATQMLTTFQTSFGRNLSVAALARISEGTGTTANVTRAGVASAGQGSGPSTSAFCTDCTHGVLAKLLADTLPLQNNLKQFGNGIAKQCAFDLTTVPLSLSQTANLGTNSKSSPSASSSPTNSTALPNSSAKLSEPYIFSTSSVAFAIATMLLTVAFASQAA